MRKANLEHTGQYRERSVKTGLPQMQHFLLRMAKCLSIWQAIPIQKIAPDGFTLNQILAEIENIFKFKDLVPMPAGTC